MKTALRTTLALAMIFVIAACGTSRRAQLHRVAKDWCETIRASQVIAVYPLTQDIQPGDVFLVQTPIDKQQDIYREDGFLPLDNHLARIHPDGYLDFYGHSFIDPANPPVLPKDWLEKAWKDAPSAAFPSYSFTATRGGGLNLALPVSGVPVGLSLLGTQSASGTVSLKDARTIGVDSESLYTHLVRDWASSDNLERRYFLESFGVQPGERPRNFLRVVTRVYLLGAIDVQLNDARSVSAGADAGVPRPVELFIPELSETPEDTRRVARENYLKGLQRLNSMGGLGMPAAPSGADADLSPEEFAAREAARQKQRDDALTKATSDLQTAQASLEQEEGRAKQTDEWEDLGDARAELKTARDDRARAKASLDAAKLARPRDPQRIEEAEIVLRDADARIAQQQITARAATEAYAGVSARIVQPAAAAVDLAQVAVDQLKELAPGGSVRYNAASSRSISMSEEFEAPIVVGYLGFDVPIGVDGELGRPIPTHALLEQNLSGPAVAPGAAAALYQVAASQDLFSQLVERVATGDQDAIRTKVVLDRMTRYIPTRSRAMRFEDGTTILGFSDEQAGDFGDYIRYARRQSEAVSFLQNAFADGGSVWVVERDGASDLVEYSGESLARLADTLRPSPEETAEYRRALSRLHRYALSQLK